MNASRPASIAIACGGTGGHLFPGIAVARELEALGARVRLFVSEKEVDRLGTREFPSGQVTALPAIGLDLRRLPAFGRGFVRAFWLSARRFQRERPDAVLGMGGFASAPPLVAARLAGARLFLHEANSVAGRANRWLAWLARESFVFFPSAARGLRRASVQVTGMPVRERFRRLDPEECRTRLGLAPDRPTLLVMGGSQGAAGLNDAFLRTLPLLRLMEPALQFVHLTGTFSHEAVAEAYTQPGMMACVRPFLAEMEVALGAADLAISRAGASSLAELAAMRVPPILIPYPTAVGNHQVHNARHFAEAGAARVIPQAEAAPERLLWEIRGLLRHEQARRSMADALTRRHHPAAARLIAERMWTALGQPLRQVDGGPDLDPAPDSIPSQPQRFPASS